jgi:TrmH family RNA methyltransferase
MLSKSKIKTIASLRLSKYRKQLGLFTAEGSTNVLDFIAGGLKIEELFAAESWLEKNEKSLKGVNCYSVNENDLKKITNLKTPPEVFGIFLIPDNSQPDFNNYDDLVIMLDDIRDPGNLGTIIRTADWFGIRQIICSEKTVDVYNPKVVQASMGSLGRVKVNYCNLEEVIHSKPDFIKVFGAVLNGTNIDEIPKPNRGIIMIGNESRGISKELMKLIDEKITIPNIPLSDGSSAESLNASIATAIICYEFRR